MTRQFEQLYYEAKGNKWFRYFTIFCRIVLALGFIPSGIVKIMGELFTALSVNHPLGHYLEALHLTGYYYTYIGVIQVVAALLLLIPNQSLKGILPLEFFLQIPLLHFPNGIVSGTRCKGHERKRRILCTC